MKTEAITAFIKAQSELGAAIKNASNPFLKNKYADINAIQDAVFPVFHANEFAIVQEGGADEFGQFLETQIIHSTGEAFTSKVYLEFKKADMQSLGGAMTYARRYGLISLTGVPVQDDDGNTANGEQHMKMKQAVSQSQKNRKPQQEQKLLERGENLTRTLKSCTAEQLIGFATEAGTLIEQIRKFDVNTADNLDQVYNEREAELGVS
jgi:hypothetical protein